MPQHLTDIACLEWVRHRTITLAPETTFGVETHLSGCPECRQKIVDFEALDRSFHAYGSAMSVPLALRVGRALKIALVVIVALAACALIVVLMR